MVDDRNDIFTEGFHGPCRPVETGFSVPCEIHRYDQMARLEVLHLLCPVGSVAGPTVYEDEGRAAEAIYVVVESNTVSRSSKHGLTKGRWRRARMT